MFYLQRITGELFYILDCLLKRPLTPNAAPLQQLWRDGTFAERVCYPAECLTPLSEALEIDSTTLASLNFLSIAYGGLLKSEIRAGQTIVINGATGCMGASAVLVALAMDCTLVGHKQCNNAMMNYKMSY